MFTTPTSATTIVTVNGMTIASITVAPPGSRWRPASPSPLTSSSSVGMPIGTTRPDVSRTTMRASASRTCPHAAAGRRRAGGRAGAVVVIGGSPSRDDDGLGDLGLVPGELEEGVVERRGAGPHVRHGDVLTQQR